MITGVIASRLGWEAIFYIEGSASSCWLILWPILIADSPKNHKFITQNEQEYITNALNPRGEERDSEVPTYFNTLSGPSNFYSLNLNKSHLKRYK